MTYTYPPETYMELLRTYNELEALSFTPEDSRETVISKLAERSAKKREIADKANAMVREYAETFEKDPAAMTASDAEALRAFLEMMLPQGTQASRHVTDYGMMLRIARILAGYCREHGDRDRYAFAMKQSAAAFHMLVNQHVYVVRELPFAGEILDLAKGLEAGEFSGKARTAVLNTLTQLAITSPDRFPVDRYRYIGDTFLAYMSQPPTELEEAVLLTFYSNALDMFFEYFLSARQHGLPADLRAARPFLEKACACIREHLEQGRTFGHIGSNLRFHLLTTAYCLGDIPLEALLDGLTGIQRAAAELASPVEQASGLGGVSSVYLTCLYRFSPLPKEEIVRLSRERVREVLPKLMTVSRAVNNAFFNHCIFLFLNAASLTGSFDEFADVILETTVYADKALYIHTAMVREMSLAVFDHMIERTPEAFDGVAGHDAAYIREHKEEMRKLLSECCLFHDIGKFFMLDVVENSMRRLTDDEFDLIRQHPGNFEYIYQLKEDEDERVKCIRDCALTHHLWHDGTRGYPSVPQTKNRPFADILAIADSLDAATDYLGRPYKSGKTVDKLVEEFRAGAGTQYGPEAVAALSDPELRDKLQDFITNRREEINYQIYAFGKLREEEAT